MPHHSFFIRVKENRYRDALREAFVGLERLRRFGFHDSELERAKKEMRKIAKNYLKEKDKQPNESAAARLVDAVIREIPLLAAGQYYYRYPEPEKLGILQELDA